ncbi:MAG: aminotransferase class V-fold PLP-dependent enzyme [Bryobacteraceae bacterium]
MKIETLAVHAGRHADPATGAVASPIYLSSTYERDPGGGYPRGFSYSREDNPNRRGLEECLAAIEGGKEALALSSGLSVVAAVVQGLEPGDHLLLSDDTYYGARKVIHEVFAKWPLETTYADFRSPDAVRAAMRPNTRLVWFETPSNPLLKIVDLAAIGEIARKTKAISVCDATFATPVLQRPLDHQIDMVMHSTTKYIAGHSDSLGGALVTRHDNYLFERVRKFQKYAGAVPSPFECWLTLRGIETLPWRVRAQSAHALEVARYLSAHPRVERVYYPGLDSHEGHAVAAAQMSAFGGMVSFQVHGGRQEAMAVVARAKLFTRATSLGGTHSLIEHRASIEGRGTATPQNLIRSSIGLEHPSDLIADLAQALG